MTDWLIIISTILLSAIFSGLEIAFITADKMLMEIINKKGGITAKVLTAFTSSPSRFIATLLIGNNLALVTFGVYMEELLEPQFKLFTENTLFILLLQTIVSTIVILLFAEYLPKTLFRLKPNLTLRFFSYPMYAIFWSLKWVVISIVGFSKFILRKFLNVDIKEDKPIFGRMELKQYLNSRTKNTKDEEKLDSEVQYYKNVLDFQSVKVRDCMVPRTEIIALEFNTSLEKLNKVFIETGHSKILIFKDSIDEIIGFVHSKEVFKQPKTIASILLPIGYIPESMLAQRALNNFIQLRKSVLIVVDEFGGTAGMLTVEDILEEILGEIEDEHDKIDLIEEQLSDFEFLFSGRLEVDYLNKNYNLRIPTNESYETIAGYIFLHTESIPKEGDVVLIDQFSILIEKVGETRIELIKLVLTPEGSEV
jgi:putative hemolysin|tara:strand:- start:11763 stop:13031 length:1269 start_codon:yes stop_codon:yes gene_type:complete